MTQYEPLQAPRFTRETIPGGYEYRIPARKNWFALLFLPVWLAGWSAGGFAAVTTFNDEPTPFLGFWLIGWLLGWLFAASTIAYMLTGREVIRCYGGELSAGWRMLFFSRLKTYRAADIKSLAACDIGDGISRAFAWQQSAGPVGRSKFGTIRFNYGARTIYMGAALDRAEAEQIVSDLHRSIPGAA